MPVVERAVALTETGRRQDRAPYVSARARHRIDKPLAARETGSEG